MIEKVILKFDEYTGYYEVLALKKFEEIDLKTFINILKPKTYLQR